MRPISKRIQLAYGIVSAMIIGTALASPPASSGGRTWVVDPSGVGDSRTIAGALGKASPGDTVRIEPGLFHELIALRSGVAIIGADSAAVVVEYDRDQAVAVGNGVQDVTIRGLTLQHELSDAPCGSPVIVLEDCRSVEISGNVILGSGYLGVKAVACEEVTIRSNTVAENVWLGVVAVGCTGVTVTDNLIRDNKGTGISILGSDATVTGNRIEGNKKQGLLVGHGAEGPARVTVAGNTIAGSRIAVLDVTHPDEKQVILGVNDCNDNEYGLLVIPVSEKQVEQLAKGNDRVFSMYLNYWPAVDRAIWAGGCSE